LESVHAANDTFWLRIDREYDMSDKATKIVQARVVAPALKKWVESYFTGQYVHPDTRKELEVALRYAGFTEGVPRDKTSLALKIAHSVVHNTVPQEVEARAAGVVSATGMCPRCGSAMVNVGLASGDDARYCSNTKCRVSAFIGE
jgi:hypothetical protein